MNDDLGIYQVLAPSGELVRDLPPELDDDLLTRMYRWMVLTRTLDARMVSLQRQGRIAFYGPITGQEAATVASGLAAGESDWIVPALREGVLALVRGLPLVKALAQFIGNSLDDCRGRQMPCHASFAGKQFVSMSSCIASQIPHAVGIAMAARIRREHAVVLGYLGDGATSEPDFHAGLNFAGVFRAPVVLICQNNQWAISVPVAHQTASETIAMKGRAYGVPSVRVDGNDALAVHTATRRAVERARKGDGPTFLELLTYRVGGHTTADDPTRYRDETEVATWRARDPIKRLRDFLEQRGIWSSEQETMLNEQLQAEISAAVEEAEKAPPPSPSSLFDDVYHDVPRHLRDQREEMRRFIDG